MPPKKKARTSSRGSSAAGPSLPAASDLPEALVELKDWISLAYNGRHGFNEEKKFPVGAGGTFVDIVQRCWTDPDNLLDKSFDFCKTIGLLKADATEEFFMDTYLKTPSWPPVTGSFFPSSILQWSFDTKSFWRSPDMASVFDLAKSIAMVGWREARREPVV